jgi:Protein of unknown function (DUF1091)
MYKPARNVFGIFSFGFTILKPAHKVFVRNLSFSEDNSLKVYFEFQFTLDTYEKNSANRYNPTLIRVPKTETCQILENNMTMTAFLSIFRAIYPPLMAQFGFLFHPCPYYVQHILVTEIGFRTNYNYFSGTDKRMEHNLTTTESA